MFPTEEAIRSFSSSSLLEQVRQAEEWFYFFCVYYFHDFFTFKLPRYFGDFYDDCDRLISGELNEAVWIGFRESGKTTAAKMFATWCICTEKKHYINFDSYDSPMAESSLFDITVWLQTNKLIQRDFGSLYFERQSVYSEKKMKRVRSFITSNKIKVEAFSTGVSTRGRVYDKWRPDLYILDDIENAQTVNSQKTTESIIRHIDELKGGLSVDGAVLYLGNYLSDAGVMRYVKDAVGRNPKGIVREIPVVLKNGQISWRDKYVATDEEAATLNGPIADVKLHKVSLESLRRRLTDPVFEKEMMNNPQSAGDNIFDRRRMDELIAKCLPATKNVAGFFVWRDFVPGHSYGIGADTSEGVGLDSNASTVIDFTQQPNEQVASYASDSIPPDIFGLELKRQGEAYGNCLIGPEVNATGFATLAALKASGYPDGMMYRREEFDRLKNAIGKKMGWRTTEANKYKIMFDLKKAVEEGSLVIRDERILKEMREYTQQDIHGTVGLGTRHFDLLIATAIAWAMRTQARPSALPVKEWKQPEWESPMQGTYGVPDQRPDRYREFDRQFDLFE